jgi:hypothetical protein
VASAPAVEAAMLELLRVLPAEHNAITYSSRPYLVSVPWARERLREWGIASPLCARARAIPRTSEDALISLAWLEAAKRAQFPDDHNSEIEAGIDVAGPGDDERVVYVRRGGQLIDMLATAEPEPRGRVLAFLAPYKPRLISVNVDAIGIGYNFGLHLRDHGYPVNNVNVSEAAAYNPERFVNMKAELYWALRERFQKGEVAALADETTISQLATIRYQYTPQGKVKIESKDDARKRGVKSPDRAEALMLCFGRIRPGILDFAKREAEKERQLDDDRSGRYRPPLTAERPQGNRLLEIYNRSLKAIQDREREQDDAPGPATDTFTARNVCAHCGGDLRLDGIEYHCVVDHYHSGTRPRDKG